MITVTINNQKCEVDESLSVLEATRKAGINIPTLCKMEDHPATGACRLCVVEVEGARNLQAACSTPVFEGMEIRTRTRRVREARKTLVELLLSEHCGECQTCVRNGDCELQDVAREMGIREIRYPGERCAGGIDDSTPALTRDSGKCIKCRRCVTVCGEVQGVGALFPQGRGFSTRIGPAFTMDLDDVPCVQCGQCAAVCPVGAINERSHQEEVWAALQDPGQHVVVQTAPAIRAALGECFNYEPGTLVTGKMTTALRKLGFDSVFDTNFTADLTIMEEGTELLTRLKRLVVEKDEAVSLPMFTSCSPGWIRFAEYFYPEFLPNISTCKSPQQMFGSVAKTYYAGKLGKKAEEITVVSVMPCTAKKYEAQRPEMNDSGVRDVDFVLTTRELAEMIKSAGIDFRNLDDGEMDAPMGLSSGAADIFANTGGVMEAAIRTAYELVTGRELPLENLHVEAVAGLEGIKEASLKLENCQPDWAFLEGVDLKVAAAHGLSNARKLLEALRSGLKEYHFVEVMTCPGGCIGGGGQPRYTDDSVRLKRMHAIFQEDEGKVLRKSHNNPQIAQIYSEFLGAPLGDRSHHLLHTHYTAHNP
ncbi:4Fe-4S dicluster domain-containing protein [Puniceicoccales bacterium CK1056]|uniref:4Fe-4S dicluster domain-containing protein n=1 Tax=Oceanipulchritudo coccoides TaxID=2706888 RepID=A0A6B2M3M8_9BACT|nr:NADH-dependent [FeFe] hydrogenase, group A6 [Oceanipulchritudo coccoides]NDV63568.1 4Fe-4S dicluster domain-containing protein [Oceanipulchritudo coccoides]